MKYLQNNNSKNVNKYIKLNKKLVNLIVINAIKLSSQINNNWLD